MTTPQASLDTHELRRRMLGCWIGKAVGGTLGQPWEGHRGPLDLTFYSPPPTEMIPNDDLDLQVVWAEVISKMKKPAVDRHVLGQAWLDHVQFPWDEYGVAIRNLKHGLKPPQTGRFDNWFTTGMGAAIRTEIWACLAPGEPALAAAYAWEDACVDHAGAGIEAAQFFASLQSLAFIESDRDRLLDQALSQLDPNSLIARAVTDTRIWWNHIGDWLKVREHILQRYGRENFTDVTMNVAFTILGWHAGDGDFSKSICIAVNCGMDTDCTGATLGAIFGIIEPDSIDTRWTNPIGHNLVLSPGIVGLNPPPTLHGFTDLILQIRDQIAAQPPARGDQADVPTDNLVLRPKVAFVKSENLDNTQAPSGLPVPVSHAPTLLSDAQTITLPGTFAELLLPDFKDQVMLIEYRVRLDQATRVTVVFNAHQANRIWLDGAYLFGRDHGPMIPAAHRAPENQWAEVDLAAGDHKLLAAVRRPDDGCAARWVVVIADTQTLQWLPDALVRG